MYTVERNTQHCADGQLRSKKRYRAWSGIKCAGLYLVPRVLVRSVPIHLPALGVAVQAVNLTALSEAG